MARKQPVNYFTSIELGTHTIKVLMARELPRAQALELIGCGEADSLSVVKGEIANVTIVREQLRQAIRQAEAQSGVDVRDTYVALAISGGYVSQRAFSTEVAVAAPDQTITQGDINQAILNARKSDLPADSFAISTTTRLFRLGDGRETLTPLGMLSDSLSVTTLTYAASQMRLMSAVKCVGELLERDLNEICYTPLALVAACLRPADVTLAGQLILDLGAGVTSYAVLTAAGCYTAGQLTVGAEHAANDLSLAFGLPIMMARQMLCDFGRLDCSVAPGRVSSARLIELPKGPGMARSQVRASSVELVVRVRLQELFAVIRESLEKEKALCHVGGTVLLSGGLSSLPGVCELAQSVFGMAVAPARPHSFRGLEQTQARPGFVTPLGTLQNARRNYAIYRAQCSEEEPETPSLLRRLWRFAQAVINF